MRRFSSFTDEENIKYYKIILPVSAIISIICLYMLFFVEDGIVAIFPAIASTIFTIMGYSDYKNRVKLYDEKKKRIEESKKND